MTTKTKPKNEVGMGALDSLSGFGDLSFSDLMANEKSTAPAPAASQLFNIADIEEDPDNVRKTFNLDESRATIRQRLAEGRPPIRTPVSLKKHPTIPGKYILNDGARRYRSAKAENVLQIPGVIDEDYDAYDKMLVNLSREGHTPMEVANFIQLRLAAGDKKGEIAKRLGKPASYVSKHAVLIDMPAKIAEGYDANLCMDVEALYLLVTNYETHREQIDSLIDAGDPIGQIMVKSLLAGIIQKESQVQAENAHTGENGTTDNAVVAENGESSQNAVQGVLAGAGVTAKVEPKNEPKTKPVKDVGGAEDPEKVKRPVMQITHHGRDGRILLSRRAEYGYCWIKYDEDGEELEVELSAITLTAIIDGV